MAAIPRSSLRVRAGLAAVAIAATLTLSACGGGEAKRAVALDCPNVLLLSEAEQIKRYKRGPGRDITDVLFEAGIVDFRGSCKYDKDDNEVAVELSVTFMVARGPANKAMRADFDYFVAVPRFYPQPQGRRKFRVSVPFGSDTRRLTYRDKIDMVIPLKKGERGSAYDVYLGFQLTHAEARDLKNRGR